MSNNNMSTEPEVRVPYDENGSNGLLIHEDKFIPDELMIELFYHYIDHKSLKSCQLVCKRWKLLIQSYIWRKKAEIAIHHSLPVDENAPWTMYYLICDRKLFNRNLIKNHSGEKGLEFDETWKILDYDGHQWKVESPPLGVPPLPQDPDFEEINHCFVTSFDFCWKEQVIDLKNEGASDYLMDEMQPTVKVSEWYSCRWDCSATYSNKIQLLTESNTILKSHRFSKQLKDDDQGTWFKFEYEFKNYGKGLRKIIFGHGGKDNQYWSGHYGSKMTRACITLELPKNKKNLTEE